METLQKPLSMETLFLIFRRFQWVLVSNQFDGSQALYGSGKVLRCAARGAPTRGAYVPKCQRECEDTLPFRGACRSGVFSRSRLSQRMWNVGGDLPKPSKSPLSVIFF